MFRLISLNKSNIRKLEIFLENVKEVSAMNVLHKNNKSFRQQQVHQDLI